MFTFGYKLKLVKKKDLADYEVFEKSVYAIHQQVNDFGQWLSEGFDLDENTVHQLSIDVEGLHTFVDVYFDNKYSSPSVSFMLFRKMDDIRRLASNMIDVINESTKLRKAKMNADQAIKNGDVAFDIDEFNEDCNKAAEMVDKQLTLIVHQLLASLKCISITIESDLIKLILGVDIMDEYKRRCKRLLKNKDLATEFSVHFKAVTKSDRQFLEKEKVKNERRRTRTSDGGISKGV